MIPRKLPRRCGLEGRRLTQRRRAKQQDPTSYALRGRSLHLTLLPPLVEVPRILTRSRCAKNSNKGQRRYKKGTTSRLMMQHKQRWYRVVATIGISRRILLSAPVCSVYLNTSNKGRRQYRKEQLASGVCIGVGQQQTADRWCGQQQTVGVGVLVEGSCFRPWFL
jgi:hypothetical protein